MKYRDVALFFAIASLFLLFAYSHAVGAANGKTVKLTVPNLLGDDWCEPQDRIRSILTGIEGVLKYNLNAKSFTVTVTFDNKKTSVDKIIEKLTKGGYPVSGKPRLGIGNE